MIACATMILAEIAEVLVALGMSRFVPDEFRELAEKDQ
ncbi:hypothetical protein V1279_001373 [Bradyrhizobium sp. AZCC 1610]